MTTEGALSALRDRPFDLLAALEARLAATGEERGTAAARADWSGLAFRLDDMQYVAPQADVREILDVPALTRVPGGRPWLLGVANIRGELLPITDLGRFLGRSETVQGENSRVIVLNDPNLPAGLLVDGVGGFRHFAPEDQRHELLDDGGDMPAADFLLGAFVRDGVPWRVMSLRKLAADPRFRDAGN